jgi:hypothetical protein
VSLGISHAVGYAVDYAGPWLLVNHAGVAHELAQGGLTVVIALMLFALQRYWIFSPTPSRAVRGFSAELRP